MNRASKLLVSVWTTLAISSLAGQDRATDPDLATIITSDVAHFWAAYDRLATSASWEDSVRAVTEEYFDRASPGLVAYIRIRLEDPANVLRALKLAPRYYAAVRSRTLQIEQYAETIRESLQELHTLYPAAVFPPIYFMASAFISQGTFTDDGLFIGVEMVAADESTPRDELPSVFASVDLTPAVLPCIVIHELVHYQQDYGPGQSLLAQVLREGVADFLAVRAVGCPATAAVVYEYGDAHEEALWAEFQGVMHTRAFAGWLYNGATSPDRPANLGYWMGYQLAEAYYESADDKAQAIDDLLHIADIAEFVRRSTYDGGSRQ